MKTKNVAAILAVFGFLSIAGAAWAEGDEQTITGVVTAINRATRIATVTPASGPAIYVQFAFDAGGPCDKVCLGAGRSGPTFDENVTEGSTWTLTYTTSIPEGAATWFPGGTVHTVYRAVKAKTDSVPRP